jgi:hypothetical protein
VVPANPQGTCDLVANGSGKNCKIQVRFQTLLPFGIPATCHVTIFQRRVCDQALLVVPGTRFEPAVPIRHQ